MPKLEALIVAFNYLDLLSITLPENLKVFDHIVVLTKENDPIIDFCKKLDPEKISVITTDAFHHDGAKFNKGLVMNIGFKCLIYKEFVTTLDGDTICPPEWRDKFLNMPPDKEKIYGSRRINFDTYQDWEDFKSGNKKLEDFMCFRGFLYGYQTMWHHESSTFQRLLKNNNGLAYPYWVKEARDIDWIFVRNWDNGQIIYDPHLDSCPPFPDLHKMEHKDYCIGLTGEIPCYVYHLGEPGKNHEGRGTEEFK